MEAIRILSSADLAHAAQILRAGGLLGFPTETVYGLAADAENPAAVQRIFSVKGRPTNHPLIVHLAEPELISQWAINIPNYAWELASAFWPGPLTVILPRSQRAKDFVTGGHATVGLRVPANPVGLALLRESGVAVAAPSANRFGSVSPTSAAHVVEGLNGYLDPAVDAVLDGGLATVGLESTIVDCTSNAPKILRPGAITANEIASVTGLDVLAADGQVAAPGTMAAHYAPSAKVHLVAADRLNELTAGGLIALAEIQTPSGLTRLANPADAFEYARNLYDSLRTADKLGLRDIYVVVPAGTGIELAIADRLQKASVGSGGSA